MARPPTRRHAIRSHSEKAYADPTELTANRRAAATMTFLRPQRSASPPANQAPAARPRSVMATVKPRTLALKPKSAWMESTAPLMTAVSKPNRSPPTASRRQ